ncbi:MAG: hypothetical protein ACHQ1D_01690 [Nitrososphaerales archaeon]|jgi:hypothetical protein
MTTLALALILKISTCMADLQAIIPMTNDEKFQVCSKIVKEGKKL